MKNTRISVTWLDQYQYYLDSDMSENELYQCLYGDFKPTIAMQAGTAFHSILEHGTLANPICNGFAFTVSNNLDGTIELGDMREVKHVVQLIDGVDLVGKIDAETTSTVIDHKLTGKFNPERYIDSWQWRAYLSMRNKPQFKYQIFEHGGIEEAKPINIKAYHELYQYAYRHMVDEVKDCLSDLAKLISKWGK